MRVRFDHSHGPGTPPATGSGRNEARQRIRGAARRQSVDPERRAARAILEDAARALVGRDDRAALLKAPHRRSAARRRRRATPANHRDQAGLARIETRRHLQHHRVELARAGRSVNAPSRSSPATPGASLTGGSLDYARSVRTPDAAAVRQVDQSAPVRPDRASPQFDGGRLAGIGEGRWRRGAQARKTQARGQRVVAASVEHAARASTAGPVAIVLVCDAASCGDAARTESRAGRSAAERETVPTRSPPQSLPPAGTAPVTRSTPGRRRSPRGRRAHRASAHDRDPAPAGCAGPA